MRIWPTRRIFEARHLDLAERLEQVQLSCDDLAVRLDHLGRAQARLVDVQAELQNRLRRDQALTARTLEALGGWPELLACARAAEGYESAFSDPNPLVSIPIPTYHSPETLVGVALASVRRQTHENWEAIVVGDHCTDDTEERVRAIGDSRIRFHNLPVREPEPQDPFERWAVKGTIPRSVGIEMAHGKWIAPLSHDDEWDDDHVQTLLAAAQENRAEIAYSKMRTVEESARERGPTGSLGAWPPRAGQWHCQSAIFHGGLRFLRPSRTCALASEANDWNLARRAWEAGVRFYFVERETSTLFIYPRWEEISAQYHELGLPPSAAAAP